MNRRDIIFITIILFWGGFWLFGASVFNEWTPNELIATFGLTLLIMLASLIILTVLSVFVKPFGKWGDQKIINKRKIAHRRWQRRWNRAWKIACNKAYGMYSEDIDACHPDFYFWDEYYGLRGKDPKGYGE